MYLSPYGANWLATQLAAEDIDLSLHTGVPGDSGTLLELSSAGGRAYARPTVAAAAWQATTGDLNNPANITAFTPNATDVGGPAPVVSHLGYWLSTNFWGWTPLSSPVTLVAGTPFVILAGTARIRFALQS